MIAPIKHSNPNYKPFPQEVIFQQNIAKLRLAHPDKHFVAPQVGPQTRFHLTDAMMCVFGGAAGGGKSFALVHSHTPYIHLPKFTGAIFRETYSDLRMGGGIYGEAKEMYQRPELGGIAHDGRLEFNFPSGAQVALNHCQYDKDVAKYRSSQLGVIGIDEASLFNEYKIMGLWQRNRNRGLPRIKPLFAMGTNPDPDCFLRELVDWWIDEEGYPIPERDGIIRWFMRNPYDDTLEWRATKEQILFWYNELRKEDAKLQEAFPISFTFIGSKLEDNPAMLLADPDYGSRIAAQTKVWRERMGAGNWNVKPVAGDYFQRKLVMDTRTGMPLAGLPTDMFRIQDYKFCWGWDLAMTAKREGNDPDYTCGVLMAMSPNNRFYIMDCVMERLNPRGVKELILDCARKYPEYNAVISLPLEAALGAGMTQEIQSHLAGFRVHTSREEAKGREGTMGAKEGRFYPFSSQVFNDGVRIVHSGSAHDWKLERYLMQLEALPFGKHDDAVDATSRAFTYLTSENVGGMVIY